MPVAVATTRQRDDIAGWLGANDDLLRTACSAHAMVVHTPLHHAAFAALDWRKRHPMPARLFDNAAEAEAWLRAFERPAT